MFRKVYKISKVINVPLFISSLNNAKDQIRWHHFISGAITQYIQIDGENGCRWKNISPAFMYLRLTTFTKTLPKCHFTHIFSYFYFALGLHPRLCWLRDRSHIPMLFATVSTVCTTDARLAGVGRVPPPQQKSWLVRWLSKPIIKLDLSESCWSMYTKCIQCQYHTHNLLSIYWIQWTDFVYFLKSYSLFQHEL